MKTLLLTLTLLITTAAMADSSHYRDIGGHAKAYPAAKIHPRYQDPGMQAVNVHAGRLHCDDTDRPHRYRPLAERQDRHPLILTRLQTQKHRHSAGICNLAKQHMGWHKEPVYRQGARIAQINAHERQGSYGWR